MAKRTMKDEFDAIRETQALREMSDNPVAARRAMDATNQTAQTLRAIQAGKTAAPTENDMGPTQEEVAAERARMQEALLQGAKEGMGGKALGMKKGGKVKAKCMASGGKVSQLAKANGIAVRGKSRGRIC